MRADPELPELALPVRPVVVVLEDAPPVDEVVSRLHREGLTTELTTAEGVRKGDLEGRILLVWTASGAHPEVTALARWRQASSPTTVLLGCAPTGTSADSEAALDAGFDDFVAGRASARELAARMRAMSRRLLSTSALGSERLRFGRITLDRARHELYVDDGCVQLTAMELALLWTLVSARGRALTRAELLDAVWGKDNLDVGLRAVDNLVQRLRGKLGTPDLIVTVRGVGFRVSDR